MTVYFVSSVAYAVVFLYYINIIFASFVDLMLCDTSFGNFTFQQFIRNINIVHTTCRNLFTVICYFNSKLKLFLIN